jgi:LuxR family maltose regulon positive regulatory protein
VPEASGALSWHRGAGKGGLFVADLDKQSPTEEVEPERDEAPRWEELERDIFGFQPLSSKLRPPRARLELVARRSLLDRLLHQTEPLVLVSAPAGAGKTTLLTQWFEEDPRPTAWLSLDSRDSDPIVLLRYLALALMDVATVDPAVLDLLQLRSPPVRDRVLPSLAASVRETSPFLLVLDDAHLVEGPPAWDVIASLLDQLAPGSKLALGSRSEPSLRLARLRVEGRLTEVRMDDLAMDHGEARQLLDLHGVALDDDRLQSLLDATEGWATGARLLTT